MRNFSHQQATALLVEKHWTTAERMLLFYYDSAAVLVDRRPAIVREKTPRAQKRRKVLPSIAVYVLTQYVPAVVALFQFPRQLRCAAVFHIFFLFKSSRFNGVSICSSLICSNLVRTVNVCKKQHVSTVVCLLIDPDSANHV